MEGMPPSYTERMRLQQAADEFNRRDWFRCHETLETLWADSRGERRQFYQGILQIAAALHHWQSGNYRGAMVLLDKGAVRLRRFTSSQPLPAGELAAAAARFREALTRLGPEHMEDVDPSLIPLLHLSPRN